MKAGHFRLMFWHSEYHPDLLFSLAFPHIALSGEYGEPSYTTRWTGKSRFPARPPLTPEGRRSCGIGTEPQAHCALHWHHSGRGGGTLPANRVAVLALHLACSDTASARVGPGGGQAASLRPPEVMSGLSTQLLLVGAMVGSVRLLWWWLSRAVTVKSFLSCSGRRFLVLLTRESRHFVTCLFFSLPVGISRLLDSSASDLGYIDTRQKENPKNLPLSCSMGPKAPSCSAFSLLFRVFCFIYNVQGFGL